MSVPDSAVRSSLVFILGDFNARSKLWWNEDITSNEGSQIDSLTTTYGLQQLISDPTHILPNSSTCINLIFRDQPNSVVDSGVHPSLHTNSSPNNLLQVQPYQRKSTFLSSLGLGL